MSHRTIAERYDRFRAQALIAELQQLSLRRRVALEELRELLGGRRPYVDKPLEECPRPAPDTG